MTGYVEAVILTDAQYKLIADRDAQIATLRARCAALERVLREIELDTKWREDLHPNDPKAMRYTLDLVQRRARSALSSPATGDKEGA